MSSLVCLLPQALLPGAATLTAFLWTLRNGRYDDMQGAVERIRLDDGKGPA